ncbi:MAG: hypothetical protein AB8H86_15855 [Polyangiales bacterium]
MKQNADERPDPSILRKAAIAHGQAADYAGDVTIRPIPDFDLDRTIFTTLEGKAARFVMKTRVGKEPHWDSAAAKRVQAAYDAARKDFPLPSVDSELLRFMVEECDFDVEHADGSFLDHLYFCFEYTVHHYPDESPLVMLLHSILGTGTNTFAMGADKIPALRELMTPKEWTHVQAFPSLLRLLYDFPLRKELRLNRHRPDSIERIDFHRVIDNESISLSGEELWTQLNYQLIHLIDFLPAANWATNANDTSFILFRDLYDLLKSCGKLEAKLDYTPAGKLRTLRGEKPSLGLLTTLIPVSLSEKMAARSVTQFSERIGHSLTYKIHWR